MIRRRQVLYVEAYDPQGAEGYYALFGGGCKRFRAVWPIALDLGPLEIQSEDFAHWRVDARGPNWDVTTDYDFLRQERFIRDDLAEPLSRHIPSMLRWMADDLLSGTLGRIFRASWRFGLVLLIFEILLLAWLAVPMVFGILAADRLADFFQLPGWAGMPAALGVAFAGVVLLRPLVRRLRLLLISAHWPRLRRFARGEATWFDHAVEAGARRLVAMAAADAADEIVVIGHSGGGVLAPAVVARALDLDPDLGRHVGRDGARLVLLTLGSIMPALALHPGAMRMRGIIARLAGEPSLTWIDCRSRKDILNFWDFDPVAGTGIDAGPRRCNPLTWHVRFKEMVSPEYYRRFRRTLFRLHYQYIMSGDRRAPYDYVMLVTGPVATAQWARDPDQTLARFAEDGALAVGPLEGGGFAAGAVAQD